MRPKYYKKSLPIHVQKQRLEDIEATGGIEKFVGKDKYLSNLLTNLVTDCSGLNGNLTCELTSCKAKVINFIS
jgi:hypothetical protein